MGPDSLSAQVTTSSTPVGGSTPSRSLTAYAAACRVSVADGGAGRSLPGVFTGALGPANPETNAVAQETYSTSDSEDIALIIATNTKICNDRGSGEGIDPPFTPTVAPPYSHRPKKPVGPGMGNLSAKTPSIFEAPAFGR